MPTSMMLGQTHWRRQGQWRPNLEQGRRDVTRRDSKEEASIQVGTYRMMRAVVTYHYMLKVI